MTHVSFGLKLFVFMPRTKQTRAYPTLKAWRDARGLSQAQAAQVLNISQKSYSRFETGERFVKGKLAKRLMDETHVPIEVLAGVA